jgi:hypothetical protein
MAMRTMTAPRIRSMERIARSATVTQPHPLRSPTASVARSAVRPAANQWRRPETRGIAPPRSSRCRQSGRSSRARAETLLRRIVQQRRTRRAGRFPAPRAGPIVVGRGSVSPYPDSSCARGSGGGSGWGGHTGVKTGALVGALLGVGLGVALGVAECGQQHDCSERDGALMAGAIGLGAGALVGAGIGLACPSGTGAIHEARG